MALPGAVEVPSAESRHVGPGSRPGRSTPLVRLRRIVPLSGAELWIKLEYLNPTGSMKDRLALSMIEGAERDGLLSPGTTVVEYTGGSTGPQLGSATREILEIMF